MSFRTFRVGGKNPTPNHDRLLERLSTFAFAGQETVEEGSVHGWVGPEHLFDGDFSAPKVLRGRYAVFAFRVDTRKVPGPLLAAHTAIAIQAALEAEGLERLGRKQKSDLKRDVKRQLLAETPPQQRAYGVFWNVSTRRVFLQATSKAVVEAFRGLFERSFELSLEPTVPGLTAASYAREHALMERLQEATPTTLTLAARPLATVA